MSAPTIPSSSTPTQPLVAKPPKAVWTQAELQLFFRTARRVLQTSEFDVRVVPKMRDTVRLLIVTPRKVGKAHVRNRFRRLVKEVARALNFSQLTYDWGIFARPSIHVLTFVELKTRFDQLIQKFEKQRELQKHSTPT